MDIEKNSYVTIVFISIRKTSRCFVGLWNQFMEQKSNQKISKLALPYVWPVQRQSQLLWITVHS